MVPPIPGIAIANPLDEDAVISYYFTDSTGRDFGNGSFTLPAKHQMASFLTEAPFNGPKTMQGTLTFSSSPAVAAIALRGLTNQRGEFSDHDPAGFARGDTFGGSGVVFPHFADGGGWTTQVVLINPGNRR